MKTLHGLTGLTVKFSMMLVVVAAALPSSAGETLGPDPAQLKKSRDKGIEFLKNSQREDGTWTTPDMIGISALCVNGLMQAGVPATDPVVAKALKKIESLAQEDGRICSAKSRIAGYETAICVMVLSSADKEKYKPLIDKAGKFLRGLQFDETKGVEKSDSRYGGTGYGPGGGRPDLSNTVFLLEALQASGAPANDPAVQKAIIFVSRCQNLETEFNQTPPAPKVNDGGFFYTAGEKGSSPAGKTEDGGLRSYGSMTYAGFKSMLYAGLDEKDPRVKAALTWIRKNYTVEENPGYGDNGLYYYYYLFAKAMTASKQDHLEDGKGTKHDWRKELAEHLFKAQQDNGSWLNSKSDRYFEANPDLVTAYVLTALKQCEAPSK